MTAQERLRVHFDRHVGGDVFKFAKWVQGLSDNALMDIVAPPVSAASAAEVLGLSVDNVSRRA